MARVPGDATAYAHRSAELMFVTISAGPPPVVEAARRTSGDLGRLAPTSSGAYANFLSRATEDEVAAIYPAATLERLREVKRRYDPENLFAATTTSGPTRPEGLRTHDAPGPRFGAGSVRWRWRWDLNPRWACTHTRFRGVLLRPLGHATAGKATGPLGANRNQRRAVARASTVANIRRVASTCGPRPMTTNRYAAPCGRGTRRTSWRSGECLRGVLGEREHQAVAGEPVPPRQLEPLPLDPRGDAEAGRR